MDQLNPFVNRIFQHAVLKGDMAIISLMLKHGIVVRRNERNQYGLTALQQSVLDGNSRLVVRLLESGADLEATTSNGWTCLHIASATGNINMVCLLLTNCADAVALTKNDELPIDLATSKDMKIILANHMSSCGHIELSQWYMGQITPLDTGVVYIMSADSLLQIACDSPETYQTDYNYYSPNFMQSYSSLVNIPNASIPDPNITRQAKIRARKGSVWSLSQQYSTNPNGIPNKRPENDCSSQAESTWVNPRDRAHRSLSSGCLLDTAEANSFYERRENLLSQRAPLPTCLETGLSTEDDDTVQAIYANQGISVTNVTDTGTMRRIKRKASTRRKISESALQFRNDWEDESVRPLLVNIDYYQDSINLQDDDDEDAYDDEYDDDYLDFERCGRGRLGSTASSGSMDIRGSINASSSGSLIEYQDTGSNGVSRDRTLLDEFAENRAALAQYEVGNGEEAPGQFEIDTDNMDDDGLSSSSESLADMKYADTTEKSAGGSDLDEDDSAANEDKNMYFNPMYKSVDVLAAKPLDNQSNMPRGSVDHNRALQKALAKPMNDHILLNDAGSRYERYGGDEEESKDRKRKKRGLLSGLVSKFRGSVKLHRTSSDTNLHSPDEGAILKRDTRKVKTLRRRRHVRRSNSFSSYFPPMPEQVNGKDECNENEVTETKYNELTVDCNDARGEMKSSASPYSPHGKDRSPLKSKTFQDNQQIMQLDSLLPPRESLLPREEKDPGGGNYQGHNMGILENGFCKPTMNGNQELNGTSEGDMENGGSRIPVRAANTYSRNMKGTGTNSAQNDNGPSRMSTKFMCK